MHHQRPEESAEDSLPGKAAASKTDVRYASEECVSSDDHHLVIESSARCGGDTGLEPGSSALAHIRGGCAWDTQTGARTPALAPRRGDPRTELQTALQARAEAVQGTPNEHALRIVALRRQHQAVVHRGRRDINLVQ